MNMEYRESKSTNLRNAAFMRLPASSSWSMEALEKARRMWLSSAPFPERLRQDPPPRPHRPGAWRGVAPARRLGRYGSTMLAWTRLLTWSSRAACHGSGAMALDT